jgi:hypothetical protein
MFELLESSCSSLRTGDSGDGEEGWGESDFPYYIQTGVSGFALFVKALLLTHIS